MNTTFHNTTVTDKKWYLIDGNEQPVGRIATKISQILMGKTKVVYSPHQDNGDCVIVINAEKIVFSGKKETQKLYYSHSGRPGGMKIKTVKEMGESKPTHIIEHAVKGMLPKNKLGRKLIRNLKVYTGSSHPHTAQTPEIL